MPKITTFLWFDNQAEEAAKHYVSIFKGSKVVSTSHYGESGPGPKGQVLVVTFELEGQEFMALNGGPHFKFTEAISLAVQCETQKEIDELAEKLSAGGEIGDCGWLKDKYGLSWQVMPAMVTRMLADKDPEKSERVMRAVQGMKKLDLAALKRAYEGKG
jgi:predicted 3-demethylubiquinone-9 3-methyltransferase (glyoxalase superfamily)